MHLRRYTAVLAFFLALGTMAAARAGEITPYEYERIRDRIKQGGSAPVSVWLLDPFGIPDANARAAELQARVQRMVAELGSEVLPGGRYVNGLGGLMMWVTEPGLEILRSSRLAMNVNYYTEWRYHTLMPQWDGHFDELDRRLRAAPDGKVDVEVTLDVDGGEFDIDRNTGEAFLVFKTPEHHQAAVDAALLLLTRLGVPLSSGLPASTAGGVITVLDVSGVTRNGTLLLRTNERGLAELAWNNWAIAMKAAGYASRTSVAVGAQPYGTLPALGPGQSRAMVSLPYPLITWQGLAYATRVAVNRRLLEDVLSPYVFLGAPQWSSDFRSATVVLSDTELERLVQTRDLRLGNIVIEKPPGKLTAPP